MSCPSSHYQYADIIVEVLWMPLGHIEILLIPTTETDPAQFKFLLLEIDFSFRLLFLASAVRSSSSHRILQSPWFRSHPDDNALILVEVSINLRWRKNIFFWNGISLTSTILTSSSSATIPLRSSSDNGPSSSADEEFSFQLVSKVGKVCVKFYVRARRVVKGGT